MSGLGLTTSTGLTERISIARIFALWNFDFSEPLGLMIRLILSHLSLSLAQSSGCLQSGILI